MTAATAEDLVSALRARDRIAVNEAAASLLDQRVVLGAQWTSVARALASNGEVSLAIRAARRAVEESADSPNARFDLAQILAGSGRQAEAAALVERMEPGQLAPGQRDHFLGTHALETGDFDTARIRFERVVERLPASGASWLSLSALPAADDAGLLRRLDAAAAAIEAGDASHRAQWQYARGTVLDRLGDRDGAFASFSAGAAIVRRSRPYDAAADRRTARMLSGAFDRAAMERLSADAAGDSARPIFVTGLPRSGTTLVEHILGSHSAVGGGGEMPFGAILAREVGGNSLASLDAYLDAKGSLAGLAHLYLHLADERLGKGRFVDKSLGTSRVLGLLAPALPRAPIVWLRRNPLDCAWSCLRTYFSQGVPWSWSLTDIAGHFRAEDALRAHWCAVLGDRVLVVPYEELVSDPRAWIDRILDHVGLAPEQAVYAAHESDRAVTTSSVAQVRAPVNRKAIGAADPYRSWLHPFIEAYGEG